jgi:hypothetical protein
LLFFVRGATFRLIGSWVLVGLPSSPRSLLFM